MQKIYNKKKEFIIKILDDLTPYCLSNGFKAHPASPKPAHAPSVVTLILRNLAVIATDFQPV